MFAVLPLVGGLLLGRFVTNRRAAIAVQIVLFAIAAAILIATAPSHDSSYGSGIIFAVILAPVSAATLALGSLWQSRSAGVAP
jgi:drug/metabolite transporter (DMT)-like permease